MALCSGRNMTYALSFCLGLALVASFLRQHWLLLRVDEIEPPRRPKGFPLKGLLRSKHRPEAPGAWDWTPTWAGRVPEDRRGFGARIWRDLNDASAAAAAGSAALRGGGGAGASGTAAGGLVAYNVTAGEVAKRLLSVAAEASEELAVLQVGACDGAWEKTNDPVQELLKDTRVRAIALEPVPYLWRELDQRLASLPSARGRLLATNAALCLEAAESVPFYVVSPRFAQEHPDAEHWAKRELGSFRRSHLHKHSIPDEYIDTLQVPCLDPPGILGLPSSPIGTDAAAIDALVVDAEGLDADLVQAMYKLEGFRPPVVIFEQKHVPRRLLSVALERLRELRYVHWRDKDQIVAVLAAPPFNDPAYPTPSPPPTDK